MKNALSSKSFFSSLLAVALILTVTSVAAQNKIVVIPLGSDGAKPLKNIITVAKENGDFSDPIAAVNSIGNASATNQYLVVIGPGTYPLTGKLVMQPFVNIAGSGAEVTRLTGSVSTAGFIINTSATLVDMANDSRLSDLTVVNTGGSDITGGVGFPSGNQANVENVDVEVSNGEELVAGYILSDGAVATIRGGQINALGNTSLEFGVYAVFADSLAIISDLVIQPFIAVAPNQNDNVRCGFVISGEKEMLSSECLPPS